MSMALGCLAHLALIAGLTLGLERAFGSGVAEPLRPWASILASTLLVLGASNFLQLVRGYGQGDASRAALLARAATGEPPAEGGLMVVTGVARPESGAPFTSPITGTPCVAYLYNIYRRRRTPRGGYDRTPVWFGAASCPFVIDAGARAVRVLAMPEMHDSDEDVARSDANLGRAAAYTQATTFEDVANIGVAGTAVSLFSDMRRVQAAPMRRDWRREGATDALTSLHLDESCVRVGETITAVGHWSPQHRALVPEPGGALGAAVSVSRGDASAVRHSSAALPSSVLAVALFGVLLLGAGLALAWAMRAGLLQVMPAAFR